MPVITCSCLLNQRFGNALFIYAFARAYAETMDCDLVTPPWIGEKIFQNVPESNMVQRSIKLPSTIPDSLHPEKMGHFFGQKDIDLVGYFQHQKFIDWYSRAKIKEWFKLKPEYASPIVSNGREYSAAHLRHGDYLKPPFNKLYAAVTSLSYERAISQFNIPRPIHWVFEGWNPVWNKRGDFPDAPDFLPDFLFLMNASHLLRANSSFSQWAGWLGNGKVYSPVVGSKVGWQDVEFVEGNHPCTAGIFRNQSDLTLKES